MGNVKSKRPRRRNVVTNTPVVGYTNKEQYDRGEQQIQTTRRLRSVGAGPTEYVATGSSEPMIPIDPTSYQRGGESSSPADKMQLLSARMTSLENITAIIHDDMENLFMLSTVMETNSNLINPRKVTDAKCK